MEHAWYVDSPCAAGLELKAPSDRAQILVNLSGSPVSWIDPRTGVRHRHFGACVAPVGTPAVLLDRADQQKLLGLVLRPCSVHALTGLTATELSEPLVPLDDRRWRRITENLLATTTFGHLAGTLDEVLPEPALPDPGLDAAAAQLAAGVAVHQVARNRGWSHATLTRRFTAAVGVRPKQYQRISRLNRVMAHVYGAPSPSWAELAVSHGYADQTHLAHDFTELVGMSPTAYLAGALSPGHISFA